VLRITPAAEAETRSTLSMLECNGQTCGARTCAPTRPSAVAGGVEGRRVAGVPRRVRAPVPTGRSALRIARARTRTRRDACAHTGTQANSHAVCVRALARSRARACCVCDHALSRARVRARAHTHAAAGWRWRCTACVVCIARRCVQLGAHRPALCRQQRQRESCEATQHARMHARACTHAHARTRMHARACTHTHTGEAAASRSGPRRRR
jgi:hypothetical protein